MSERRVNDSYCQDHSGQCANIQMIQKTQSDRDVEMKSLWGSVDARVPWRVFLFVLGLLIAILGGNFAQNMMLYTQIRDVQTDVAVIKTRLTTHAVNADQQQRMAGGDGPG